MLFSGELNGTWLVHFVGNGLCAVPYEFIQHGIIYLNNNFPVG